MKTLLLLPILLTFNAQASITGPSCDDLNAPQRTILKNAAKSYITKKYAAQKPASIKVEESDCHDYDGVHSQSIFSLEWDQTDEDQEMGCSQEIAVEVQYVGKKKVINKKSKFNFEESSVLKCVN